MFDQWVDLYANSEPNEKGLQKQYKRRVEDMAKAYGYKLTKEQLYYQVNRMIDQLTDRDIHGVMLMLEGLRKEIQDGIYD